MYVCMCVCVYVCIYTYPDPDPEPESRPEARSRTKKGVAEATPVGYKPLFITHTTTFPNEIRVFRR